MEENKFFKLVWRFNGLLISVAGVLAICVLLFGMYQIFKETTRDRNTQNIVNVEENSAVKENWMVGRFISLTDQNILIVPLNSDQSFDRGYFSKSSNSTRNYLFIDTRTNSKKWLFEHTNYLIEEASHLRIGDDFNLKKPVLAILYTLVKLDSNNDNRLTPSDKITIAISKPDGSGYKEILTNIEQVIDSQVLSENELFIMFQSNGKYFSSTLNLNSYDLSNQTELPKVSLQQK